MNKKVLAFDMDGTILKTDHITFNPTAIEAIREAKELGHQAIIATGRSLGMIDRLLVSNNIEDVFDYIVCNNGSYTYDVAKEKIITSGEVAKEEVLKLFEEGKETKSLFCGHSNEGTFICTNTGGDDNDLGGTLKYRSQEETLEFINNHTIVQASIKNTKDIIKEMEKDLSKYKNVDVCIANEEWVDLNPLGTSKLSGLEIVSKEVNTPVKDFIAFGDSGNDIKMLIGAGIGVAMENGSQEAKDAADVVIGDCNSDAIATYIRKMIKEN